MPRFAVRGKNRLPDTEYRLPTTPLNFSHASNCWFLTGPTAAGKSGVGLELARRLSGEIVSLDSMALYRGMDIGTAKPTAAERAAVPHHLIDIVEPCQTFSLAQYVEAAEQCAADILARGRVPIFVGGTPLYLKALLRGIFQGPPADWEFRNRVTLEAQERGAAWLHGKVSAVDPAAAERLHPQDTKRLVRVLEVYEKTGRPISALQRQFEQARPAGECRVFVLDWPRAELYRRINARVEAMFSAGLVEEVRGLLARDANHATDSCATGSAGAEGEDSGGRPSASRLPQAETDDVDGTPSPRPSPGGRGGKIDALSHTARQALGYREAIEYLAGGRTLAETIELVQNRTRAFARRQLTWFRSLSECRWVSVTERDAATAISDRIAAGAS